MGWIDPEGRESRRGWYVGFDSDLRPDMELMPNTIHDTFESALKEFESEKKKHSMNMAIFQVGVTKIFDGSHIVWEDAYGLGLDGRSWIDVDKEGRESIPPKMLDGETRTEDDGE